LKQRSKILGPGSTTPRHRFAALWIALMVLPACHKAADGPTEAQSAELVSTAPAPDASNAALPAEAPPSSDSWLDGSSAQTAAAALPPGAPNAGPDPMAPEIKRERLVQQSLPQSGDPIWRVLRTTKIIEDQRTGYYIAQHSPAVRALVGKTLTIRGFMLPIEQEMQTHHFLLSRYTPVCFFCPPGDPNEVVEVRSQKALPAGYDMVTVTGTFSIADNGEKGLFFRLESNQ